MKKKKKYRWNYKKCFRNLGSFILRMLICFVAILLMSPNI